VLYEGLASHSGRKLIITAQSQVGGVYKKRRKKKGKNGQRGNREKDDIER
jgi:hypothetical protein